MDQDSVVGLMMAQRDMLIGYVDAIVRNTALAEDILQEVAIIVLRKHADLTDAQGFGPWIRSIARFQALNALRKRENAPLPLGETVADLIDIAWSDGDGTRDAKRIEWLRQCMETLTERAQELVRLRYHQDLSGAEIASVVKRPLNTVYVSLARIHRSLAECMHRRMAARTSDG